MKLAFLRYYRWSTESCVRLLDVTTSGCCFFFIIEGNTLTFSRQHLATVSLLMGSVVEIVWSRKTNPESSDCLHLITTAELLVSKALKSLLFQCDCCTKLPSFTLSSVNVLWLRNGSQVNLPCMQCRLTSELLAQSLARNNC